jgi:hypothetical protein
MKWLDTGNEMAIFQDEIDLTPLNGIFSGRNGVDATN